MNRKRQGGQDSRQYYDWLDRAEDDMIAAEVLLKDSRCTNSCAFHCQQAIEKALKAYLLLRIKRPMDGHNLSWLCKQAVKFDRQFVQWLDESASLNRYYIETRYPTDFPQDIGDGEVRRAFSMAKEMYIFINDQVEEEMERRAQQSLSTKRTHKNKYPPGENKKRAEVEQPSSGEAKNQ